MEKRCGWGPPGRDALPLGEWVSTSRYLQVLRSQETSRTTHPKTKRHVPPDTNPQPCRSENPSSRKVMFHVRYRPNFFFFFLHNLHGYHVQCFPPTVSTIPRRFILISSSCCSYRKDERAKPGNFKLGNAPLEIGSIGKKSNLIFHHAWNV